MTNDSVDIKFSSHSFWFSALAIIWLWFIYWIEIQFDYNFNKFGILPRDLIGLRGILFSPFIHSSTSHLFNNSIPLFVLLLSLLTFYREISFRVLIYGVFFSGLFTWVIGRESYHIGASGIIYLLFSFIFFSGIIRKHYRLIAMSLIIIFLYGSMIWYVFPTEDRISWEGHLTGFVVGVLLAVLFRKKGIVKEEFQFSQNEFDSLFDENGNLINEDKTID